MIHATWNWLWNKHNQTKDLFTFFVKPTSSKLATGRSIDPSHSRKNGRGNNGPYKPIQLIGLILGPLLFLAILLFFSPKGLSQEGIGVLASTTWIAIWWMTEAIPIPATSLLPIVLFPLLGSLEIEETTAAYGSDTIFLFMGGFMIALAMEKWELHRRIALNIISVIGTNTDRIILGFMIATGFLSMFISNTATALMMVPIGLAVIYQISEGLQDHSSIDTSKENFGFGKALMLSIAYSASIGGVATLIGTPPNAVLAGVLKTYGVEVSFAKWMLFGVPVAIVFMFVAWFYLVKIAYPLKVKEMPGGKAVIDDEKRKLGSPSFEEKAVFIIFSLAALSWIFRSALLEKLIPNIDDAIIAMTFAIILFLIPSKNKEGDRLLDWNTAVKLPWGILLMFGGGLAIAEGFSTSGLSEWIGGQLTALQGIHLIVVLLVVSGLVLFLTEITSNTATATMMYPIMIALAVALEIHPYSVMVAAAVSASCAFMLPVATPPNAVVFGSGYLRIPDMAKAGLLLNIIGTIIITIAVYYLLPLVWGIDLTHLPDAFRN